MDTHERHTYQEGYIGAKKKTKYVSEPEKNFTVARMRTKKKKQFVQNVVTDARYWLHAETLGGEKEMSGRNEVCRMMFAIFRRAQNDYSY